MSSLELANNLAQIDELDAWKSQLGMVEPSARAEAFKLAEPIWVKRMLDSGKLLVHPDVEQELRAQQYLPNDLQKRMIWASVLATADGENSKERFKNIKDLLLKKYGRKWWEDVFKRKTNAWAAKERIRTRTGVGSPILSALESKTILFSGAAAEERDRALRMIPSS